MNLSSARNRELEEAARRAQSPAVRKRALALVNVSKGTSITAVAKQFLVTRQSIYNWLERYAIEGIEGLWMKPGRGRKVRADHKEVESYVRQSPRHYGVRRTRWTLSVLECTVPSLRGYSLSGVRKVLRGIGLRYKRGQPWIHSPDPEYDSKKKPSI